jgi:hypothetical protein
MNTATPYLADETDQTTAPGIRFPVSGDESTQSTATGEWFVLQPDNTPSRGLTFTDIQAMVYEKRLTPRSMVRTPGTSDQWKSAAKVRGLSREFGVCYSCGGDIETFEISCPHCERPQTLPEQHEAPTAAPPTISIEIEDEPQTAPPIKAAEPTIHVHTRSEHDDREDLEFMVRPVIAEQFERHIPKDDLLTPRDVAKAFQLEFGVQVERADKYFDKAGLGRRFRILLCGALAMVIAVSLAWPLVQLVSARINATPAAAQTSADANLLADARPAADPITPSANDATELHPAPSADPIIVPDPAAAPSSEDDPSTLWAKGIDAESTGNYTKAVEAYERIESLPSYLWPAHLEVRLQLARKELKGDVK